MKASLSNFRQSPQKVRLVADMIRGKSIAQARMALQFMPKKSSPAVLQLLNSAVANARQHNADIDSLFVKTITVNKGAVLKRFAPRARGRAARFSRTMSIIAIELGSKHQRVVRAAGEETVAKKPVAKKAAKKTAKKAAKKAE